MSACDMASCVINEPPFHQCCCVCKNHVPTEHHDTKAQGFACVVWRELEPAGKIMDGWPDHSVGCEMWHDIRKHP